MDNKKKTINPRRRFITGISVGLLLIFSATFFTVFIPMTQVQAFIGPPVPGESMMAAVWKEAKDQVSKLKTEWKAKVKEAWKITKDVAFKNALRIYLTKIAEDTATYIATGDPGQKPLFLEKPGEYFMNVGDAALGDYLDTISSGALGTSLCDIGSVNVKIDLALRAEINPNFCADGCQSSYEKKLNTLKEQIVLRDAMRVTYDQFQAAQAAGIDTDCSAWDADEAQCNSLAPDCFYCTSIEVSAGDCTGDQMSSCVRAAPETSRQMTDAEKHGANETQEKIIKEYCLDRDTTDLETCLGALSVSIEDEQQTYEYDRQRCVRLCTGAKRTAKCSFTQIRDRAVTAYENDQFRLTYPQIFEADQNEVGQYLFAYESSREQAELAKQQAKDTYTFDEIGSVKTTITGSITAPKTMTQAAAQKSIQGSDAAVTTYTGSPIADAIGVFTDTLTKKLIERIFNREQGGYVSPKTGSLLAGGYNSGGIAAARAQFAKAFTPNLTRTNNKSFDTLAELQGDDVLDADFAEAARQELTVEEAVASGLLHGDWWFGYNDKGASGEKTEPATGNGGYPASTFAILRSNRVIPVGWEIAAEYINLYDTNSYTLNDVLAAFDDPDSPYYQLVDPKWVLGAPLAICAKQGYSGKLADSTCQSSEVVEVTNVGEPGSVGDACDAGEHDTNGDGKCNTNDPPIYENTCEREQVCVDQQTCVLETADGKGCEEYGYCTKELPIWRFQGEQCDKQYKNCQAYTAPSGSTVSYLTDTVDSANCSSDNVGCKRYCYKDLAAGQYTCQYNPSESNYTGSHIFFDDAVQSCTEDQEGCTEFLRTTDGANILPNSSFELYTSPYPVASQADFSGWTVGGDSQTCGAQSFADQLANSGSTAMRLQQLPAANACAGDSRQYAQTTIETGQSLDNKSYTFSFNAMAINAPCEGSVTIGSQTFTPTFTDSYQRFVAATTFPAGAGSTSFTVRINSIDGCPLIIDAGKVEHGTESSAYSDYGTNAIFMKDAPASLSCTGNVATDPTVCSSYATQCTEGDVGCNAYTPVSGGVVIPGKVTDKSECDPTDPTSCDQCPAAFLGCKAYKEIGLTQKIPDPALAGRTATPGNEYVSMVAESGSQCTAQYVGCEEYTNLDAASQGGESREYYSKVRQCVSPSDPNSAYYFSWVGSASQGFELKRWHLKQSNLGSAPCTNLAVTANPNAACVDDAAPVNDCSAEFPNNPSCIQFYDEQGGVHYRYLEEVIFVTDNCAAYRNSLDAQTYYFDTTQSTTCPAAFAGCREYHGSGANNTRTLFTSTFEDVANPLQDWNGALSAESLSYPGHSLLATAAGVDKPVQITQGKSYIISFWAKSLSTTSDVAVMIAGAPNNRFFTYNAVSGETFQTINDEWRLYRFGPVEVDFADTDQIIIRASGAQGAVFDNIVVGEATSNLFVIKGSAPTCNGYENCAQYKDKGGNTQNLKSFTKLCSQNVLGCEALIDTHNSTTPFQTDLAAEQKYLQTDRASYRNNVPADSVRFLVNDSNKYCSEAAKGCQELGLPNIKQDLMVSDYQTVYLKNDPDTFTTTLCAENAVGCQAYSKVEDAGIDYFKDPQSRVCEYRENVGSNKQTGWFKKNTDTPCDSTWTYACPAEQSTCREYYASRVYKNPATPNSQSYYYLDSSLSKSSCPQGIDPKNGCLGFEDQKAGLNTMRAKVDPDDSNTVLSQSCQTCSADTNLCGRNGNSPCCHWNASTCSIDRSTGSDDVAPYYCVGELRSTDFEQCQISITNSYAVPNSSDITNATNCGGDGQPNCFKSDFSDYNAAVRYCGDLACNANIVLPVKEDRICDQWLECTNEQTVTRDGKETTVCLERTLRDQNGYISNDYGDNTKKNLEKSSPTEIKDLANYSGLTKAGMIRDSGADSLTIEGLFPYSQFEEDGLDGALIEIPNNDFEDSKISVSESPMPISESTVLGRGWIYANSYDWRVTKDAEGTATASIQLEKSNSSNSFSTQYLAVVSASTSENGVRVNISNPDEVTENAEYYQLSFRARAKNVLQQGIRVNLYQDKAGELFSDGSGAGIALTTQWEDYVMRLYNNPGATVNPTVQTIELRFLHRSGNVPSDTFYIDDVQLKPVLQVREGLSAQPVSGLAAQYFQAELVPATGSAAGLSGEYWAGTGTAMGVPPTGVPDPGTGGITWVANQIDYKHPIVTGDDPSQSFSIGVCTGTAIQCVNDSSCPASNPTCVNRAVVENTAGYRVRFTGGIYIDNPDYNTFYFNHDDGARFFVEDMNTDLLSGTWNSAACRGSYTVLRDMPTGWHPVKIEWYNKNQTTNAGAIQFGWHPGSGGLPYLDKTVPTDTTEFDFNTCGTGCGPGGLYSQICQNDTVGDIVPSTSLATELTVDMDNLFESGVLYSSATDKTVNFPNFNDRLTEQANRGDAVGVRWSGEISIPETGSYTFYLYHKDGVKFYIDNEYTPKAEDWQVLSTPTLTQYTTSLEKGYHTIKIEYFKGLDQNRDTAVMEFGWSYPDASAPAMSAGPGHIVTEQFLRSYPTSATGFVARECRSYPQSDSLVCDYEDPQTGVLYRGWKGYCVEKDPRDSSVCLNWWPIDVLSGEVNVFSDQSLSLTRSPLYYCAETQTKEYQYLTPRYVCMNDTGAEDSRCSTIAVVKKPKAAAYSLMPSDWQLGTSTKPKVTDNYDFDSGHAASSCNSVSIFGAWCKDSYDACASSLSEYWDYILVYQFRDDGGSSDDCANDNTGDGNTSCDEGSGTECIDDGSDCCYWNRETKNDEGEDVDNWNGLSWNSSLDDCEDCSGDNFVAYDPQGANWEADESFPRQCTTIVQVTKADGKSVPWTSRIQTGLYGENGNEQPILYTLGTACSPYGALPVIKSPSDILNCVPDPANPPSDGCTVTDGICSKVTNTDPGACIEAPLEIYHPDNPDNNKVSQICSQTRLGAGFYSCGGSGICKTCIGGDRNGLMCVDTEDCPNAESQDFNGDGINDSPCQQTFGSGIGEKLGASDDTLGGEPTTLPSTEDFSGVARLKQLFAQSYGMWTWNESSDSYIRITNQSDWTPPVDNGINVTLEGGTVCDDASYHTTYPNEYCGVRPTVSTVTVNGQASGNIVLSSANLMANLEFSYTIDAEQTPLKNITIDWGDSDPKSVYRSSTATKLYRCDSNDGVNCNKCYGDNFQLIDGACVYNHYPRVQVKDNWGWCNINSFGAYGCSADSNNWNYYDGDIIVKP